MTTWVPHRPLPLDAGDVRYERGPDSVRGPDVPAGVTEELVWDGSAVY